MERGMLVAMVLAVAPTTAGAQEATTARLLACRAVEAADARLACFDQESAVLARAVAGDRVRVIDTRQEARARAARFGLGDAPGDRATHLEGKVAGAVRLPDGRTTFVLADGSRWRQVDDYPLRRVPRAGDAVVIDLTSLGSYKLRVGTEAPIRVRRADRR